MWSDEDDEPAGRADIYISALKHSISNGPKVTMKGLAFEVSDETASDHPEPFAEFLKTVNARIQEGLYREDYTA